MEATILEVREFPSAELSRAGRLETHVFVQFENGSVTSYNLGKHVTDPLQIKAAVAELLKGRQAIAGTKILI